MVDGSVDDKRIINCSDAIAIKFMLPQKSIPSKSMPSWMK